VGVVLPLTFVTVGKLWQFKSIFGSVIDVKHEGRIVLGVQIAQHVQVKAVKQRGVVFLRDVPQEEAIVRITPPDPYPIQVGVPMSDDELRKANIAQLYRLYS